MMTREQFYKSKQWEAFRKVIIADRSDADGFVHCCECGKPIINKYDLIFHHKQELSEANVNDLNISLNPDNVECICFRCHNKVHERFGFNRTSNNKRPVQKQVFIGYGSPCAGKSTFVHSVADPEDLVVDLDSIWQMISINDRYQKPAALKGVVFQMRDALYDLIKYRSGKWHNAYVITGGALLGDRQRLKQRIGADQMIFIDTSMQECIKRACDREISDEQKREWIGYINDWFERFQPEDQEE